MSSRAAAGLARRGSQRGVALLTVLMVFALAAFMAADMALTGVSDSQHAAVRRDVRQAYYYALGGEAYARELLWQDGDADARASAAVDGRHDLWPEGRGRFTLEEGEIRIQVTDLQGRFNLANLTPRPGGPVDARALGQLEQLLAGLGLDAALAQRIADWIDSDGEVRPRGGEDEYHTASDAAQLTANAVPVDLGELNRLLPLTAKQYALLTSQLTSLPVATRLNLNTAEQAVLLAVFGRTQQSVAHTLVGNQTVTTYRQIDDALRDLGLSLGDDLQEALTTSSQWYEIDVLAIYRQRSARVRSMVHRDARSGVTRVVYRSPAGRVKAE